MSYLAKCDMFSFNVIQCNVMSRDVYPDVYRRTIINIVIVAVPYHVYLGLLSPYSDTSQLLRHRLSMQYEALFVLQSERKKHYIEIPVPYLLYLLF